MSFKDKVGDLLTKAVNVFGEDVKYRSKSGGSVKIRGVFDHTFEFVDPNTNTVVSSNAPRLGIKLADLPFKPLQGDTVQIGSTLYKVVDALEDGQGGASLHLNKT
jgi:hypothetical protein